jgi:chemotaxis protein methyltransferase CheR
MPRTSSETYFFRDHGQFNLLRLRLLPELIERQRPLRTLRLWSAGCASGEEAYSIAMLVDILLPERDGWNILILGSDIDQSALKKARRGRYRQWSFRLVPHTLKQHFFQHQGDQWTLNERIRGMVTFRAGDLISDLFPSKELRRIDLILCRNVFIYFDSETVSTVANKLADTLNKGGYLMTGHTELIGHHVRNLQSRLFPEGVVYQRPDQITTAPPAPACAVCPPIVETAPEQTHRCLGRPPALNADDLLTTARKLADRGEYVPAEQACQQALAVAPLAPAPHFLLAQLAQLKGDFEQAWKLLNKTLYLDPHSVAAHLELAALCERAENLPRAQTLRRTALDILRTLPANTMIEPYETTATQMAQWLTQ